jgi:hypothetical protein
MQQDCEFRGLQPRKFSYRDLEAAELICRFMFLFGKPHHE